MTSLTLMIAPMLALQGVGQAPTAVKNDAPETWTLEYPRIIQPYIEDYRRCLTGRLRRVTGVADFEAQHRSDIPVCAEEREIAERRSNEVVAGRGEYSDYTLADMTEVFDHIGRIHIARGADLDRQFSFTMRNAQAAQEAYETERPRGLVLELLDASVVKARTDATAAAAQAAQEQRLEERRASEAQQPGDAQNVEN